MPGVDRHPPEAQFRRWDPRIPCPDPQAGSQRPGSHFSPQLQLAATTVMVNGMEMALQKRSVSKSCQCSINAMINAIGTISDMRLVPTERPRQESPRLRPSTKSQLTRRASSPKVTLSPCCSHACLSYHFTI